MSVPYFQVPNDIFEIGLDKFEMLAYMYLARLGNQGGNAFPSYNTIAKRTNMSKRKAIDAVKSLESKGIVKVQRRYNKELNENYPNIYIVEHNLEVFGGGAQHALGSADNAPGSAQDAPYKELVNKEIDNNNLHVLSNVLACTFVETYLFAYQHYLNKQHPRVRESDIDVIEDFMSEVKMDMERHDFERIVNGYFEDLPKNNNGNILAFIKAKDRVLDMYY